MRTTSLQGALAAALLALAAGACDDGGGDGGGDGSGTADAAPAGTDAATQSQWDELLEARELDYGQALRTASLRLRGDLPTLSEMKFVSEAGDLAAQKMAYEAMIDSYLDDPRFARQMRDFFRDSFRMGGGAMDSAPNFAAQLVVEGRSYLELFTATAGTCPTFDAAAGTFTAADCAQTGGTVGVLTDPNVMKQFFSNMAFRRVKWVQETFACTKFPAEWTTPQDVGAIAQYTSPWPFQSVAGTDTGGVVDFRDPSAVICPKRHPTMNHQSPPVAQYDEEGQFQNNFVVPTPAEGQPTVRLEDYLPPGESLAWRLGEPTADMPAFGMAMAADPYIAECAVARVWNFAMGKGDIVAALAIVPPEVIASQLALFNAENHNLKSVVRAVFTSDDFVKF